MNANFDQLCHIPNINARSSQWNNGKMKIAYNSAYVQKETFSFTFAQHAFIVYFYHAKQVHIRQRSIVDICRR